MLTMLANHKQCELTEDGAAFIKQRFDPYHDSPMKPVGYPDSYNGHTVSRCIKKTITFSQTSGGHVASTAPWDASIAMTPLVMPVPLRKAQYHENNTIMHTSAINSTNSKWGGLKIVGSFDGANTFIYPPTNGAGTDLGTLSLSEQDTYGLMRITSVGFEIIDGTAELYRQGILTCYRQNQPQKDPAYYHILSQATIDSATKSVNFDYSGTVHRMEFPPESTAEALVMPDSKQWKVSEGAYVSCDFNDSNLPMERRSYLVPIFTQDTVDDANDNVWVSYNANYNNDSQVDTQFAIAGLNNPSVIFRKIPSVPNRILPINQSGVILSGLSPQATITVNAIWYVECAPTNGDEVLLSMASQSPSDDFFCKELIARLRKDSPICVKLRENYTGQWFFEGIKDMINKVTPWLSNAQTVGNQVVKWIDTANQNDGLINPQTFVRGDAAAKKQAEQKGKIPKPPPPPPPMRAYKPKPVLVHKNQKRGRSKSRRKVDNELEIRDLARRNRHNLFIQGPDGLFRKPQPRKR